MKKHRFDYLKEAVDKWSDKEHITLGQLYRLPLCITLPFGCMPPRDYYDEPIWDVAEFHNQRDAFLLNLWKELGGYKNDV